ncbi:Tetratricopeptide-like helical [Penicillium malachiteum]|nr:Tetratricopeptide-like helical [Penicillium malachiteum]
MAGGNLEKGQRYIVALDQARAQGKWDDVPELIRKVTKHAPQQTCIIQTATAESRVVAYIQQKTTTESTSTPNLPELIPALLTTIENNDGTPQEILQARVCLGWIHWTLNEPALAASRLPQDFTATIDALLNEGQELSSWTEVCLVKGCYIKGSAQSTVASIDETLETFAALIPWLGNGKLINNANSQFLSWSEALLGKGAVMASEEAGTATPYSDARHVEIALRLFRLWSVHPAVKGGMSAPQAAYAGAPGQPSRTSIWKSYYLFLTIVLQDGLEYPPAQDGASRPQLASELRRIEGICESNILREVKFPTASSDNSQVEEWVEQVIGNWEVLCGPTWHDQDLGEGGQNAVGRNVLDILYRAATKTYHSHLILRRLFHVHSALADFDLAMQAHDSYVEIVTAAKKRAEKSAEYGELEKDETLLQTLSEGITLLCCLGSYEEAEKAKKLTDLIREYIDKQETSHSESQSNGKLLSSHGPNCANSPDLPAAVLATSYRAIGVGLANWASYTPLNEARDEIRGDAIEYLEKSIDPEYGQDTNFPALYTLALTLAENRDLDGAIDYAKSALASHNSSSVSDDLNKQRDLVPFWHLLALILSAKQEFDIAERSCEAAFEHFPSDVFSKSHREQRRSSRHSQNGIKRSLVSRLQGREKERILQTRITQLAFTEVLEGPEAAVNQSEQLLGLFGNLFQELDLDEGQKRSDHLVPPKSSAGTTKSFRSSIFHRNRVSQLPDRRGERSASSQSAAPPVPSLPNGFSGSDAPEIQVTDEDFQKSPGLGRSDSKKLRKRSFSSQRPDHSRDRDASVPHENEVGIAVSGNSTPVPRENAHSSFAKQPLQPIPHNVDHRVQPYPVGHEDQPPQQDVRLPAAQRFDSPTSAITKFSVLQSKKHALALLVKIWLIIAGLYRRASLFDDAREACEEALKQTARMEALASTEESSARHFSKRGWTAAKSPEELWADVYAEEGLLCQAQDRPHHAMKYYEDALLRHPEHPIATIGLANLLLDIWDQKLAPESTKTDVDINISRLSLLSDSAKLKSARAISADELKNPEASEIPLPVSVSNSPHEVDPKHLHRLAARDRAYGLLSVLTKLGSSWDNSEAWYALSRAYEAGEQTEKLKEVLWWCIELEDRRPIRHWSNIGSGLYVL